MIARSERTVLGYVRRYAKTHDVSKAYVVQLKIAARSYGRHQARSVDWSEVSDESVNDWLVAEQAAGSKAVTVHSKRRALLTLWRAAYDDKLVDRLPTAVRRIKCPEVVPVAFLLDELRSLRDAAEKITGMFPRIGVPRRIYWLSFLDFKYDTALRLGDVLSIERSWIWPGGRVSFVQHKTGHSHTVQLRQRTMDEVNECMAAAPNRQLVWPLPCMRNRWFAKFKKLRESAGLPAGTSKWIRRASASYVEKTNPGRGSSHLGHRSPELAQRYYFDPRIVGHQPTLPPEL